jgi:hypothetical protein
MAECGEWQAFYSAGKRVTLAISARNVSNIVGGYQLRIACDCPLSRTAAVVAATKNR